MKTTFIQKILSIVFLSFCQILIGQNKKIDSLSQLSFDTLERYFDGKNTDSINDIIYAKAFLKKASRVNDTILMAKAYYSLSDFSSSINGLKYTDSLINLTKNIKHNDTYPFIGYFQKAQIYYKLGKYKMALDFCLKCYELSLKNNNNLYVIVSKQSIGLIKNKIGEREEALKIFKFCVNYLDNIEIDGKDYYLTNTLYSLADSYIYNKKNDSASIIINRGLKKAIETKDSHMHAYYVYLSGVNHFFYKNYKTSIDSLLKSKQTFNDETLHATADLYLGKSYDALNEKNIAFKHFVKVDSFLNKTQNITLELLEIYKPLIEYQKDKKNIQQQLYYINSLLKYDSILNEDNKYISKKIVKNYDIPNLTSSKNQIINDLKKKNTASKEYIYFLVLLTILLLTSTIFYIKRNISNKKKFKSIINSQSHENNKHSSVNNIIKVATNDNGLPEELINTVLLKLEAFESKKKFIKNYTLTSLAKELKTNSSYLSKIINETKKCNFSNYINDLRIDFALDKLKNDKTFRAYTINAIANEVGFNTAQSFSNAFYKKTGLYPSYFIKQLEKHVNG